MIVERWHAWAGGMATVESDRRTYEAIAAGCAVPDQGATELAELETS